MIADLVAELGPAWQARRDAALLDRPRRRGVGAGAKYKLVFVDRLLATLVHLRHGVTHDVLACWFQVDRSTITRAVGEIRPLLADRGCQIDGGLRLRTLADVIAHLGATGRTALMDATEIRVRRPAANRGGRSRFISGKSRINAMKALVLTDEHGQLLFCGETRAGSVADITQARDAGLIDLLADTIDLQILADAGYQGLAAQTSGQVVTPPRKRRGKNLEHLQWLMTHHEAARFAHSSARIPVEHGIAHLKNWRALARHHSRRENLPDTIRAVTGLLSDQQAPRHSKALELTASSA
ncbi:transposase family protein [Streptomyces beijiangensis]|uniref:transposase family protein n=1 Tax=Streptomyces beijiangensis TaxID=163361 RepID=UPI0027DB619A|nr:transposase family protein [Streptomyces beijiangensis]